MSLEINHHMSTSNDKLLFDAAKIGNLKKVKDLLFKGARTVFINEVNELILLLFKLFLISILTLLMMVIIMYMSVSSSKSQLARGYLSIYFLL